MTVTIRYFAAARAATGTDIESLDLPAGCTLGDLLAQLGQRHGQPLARVLPRCSFLLDGTSARDRLARIPARATLDVLPPFAGG